MEYHIEITGNTAGKTAYNVQFATDRSENNDAEVNYIFSIAQELSNSLGKLKNINSNISATE